MKKLYIVFVVIVLSVILILLFLFKTTNSLGDKNIYYEKPSVEHFNKYGNYYRDLILCNKSSSWATQWELCKSIADWVLMANVLEVNWNVNLNGWIIRIILNPKYSRMRRDTAYIYNKNWWNFSWNNLTGTIAWYSLNDKVDIINKNRIILLQWWSS